MIGQLQTDAYKFLTRIKADSGSIVDEVETRKSIDDSIAQSKEIIDSASLVMIPTGSKSGKLHSLKPTDGTGDFTVARNSVKWVLGKDGYYREVAVNVPALEWSPTANKFGVLTEAQRTNLLTRSHGFVHSYWTKSGATIEEDITTAGGNLLNGYDFTSGWTAINATVNNSNTFTTAATGGISKSLFLIVGQLYQLIITGNTNSSNFRVLSASGAKNISVLLTGAFNTTISFVAEETGIYLYNYGTGTTSITSLSIKSVSGYDCPFVNSSGVNLKRGFKLTATGANGYIRLSTALTVTAATAYSNSIFVKRLTGTGAVSLIDTNGTDRAITVTSDWQRFTYTATSDGTTGQIGIKLATSGDEVMICQGDIVQGASSGSPIFTDGATVTRLADVITKSTATILIGQTEGTLYADITLTKTIDESRTILDFYESGSKFIQLVVSSDLTLGFIVFNGTTQCFIKTALPAAIGQYKIAGAYNTNDAVLVINGTIIGTDNVVTIPDTSLISVGKYGGSIGTSYFNDVINSVIIVKQRISNVKLQELTTL